MYSTKIFKGVPSLPDSVMREMNEWLKNIGPRIKLDFVNQTQDNGVLIITIIYSLK
jgi:hypothetical protein